MLDIELGTVMAKASDQRPLSEKIFLIFFFPAVLGFYLIYKYPHWLLPAGADLRTFHLFGKSPGFWYATVYTALVCGTCLWVVITNKNRYQRSKKKGPLSTYQRNKFISIFIAQFVGFYLIPHVILPLVSQKDGFFNDPAKVGVKTAHVYVYPAIQSIGRGIEQGSVFSAGGAIYMFVVIPVSVWFFGKRYCSWVCSCGNLAEAVGVLPWGQRWVKLYTPRGKKSEKLEWLQFVCLGFAVLFGVLLVVDGLKVFTATTAVARLSAVQDFVIDFMFGSVIGVGAYPIFGTRVWCRYGCPMAQGMKLFGKFTRSKFAVVPNDKCRGLNLCTEACPMGIDVASYAHKDKKPIEVSFGLNETPCIGCGGCIDVCPVDALSFAPIKDNNPLQIVTRD